MISAHRRLFVVDHDTNEKDGPSHALHILLEATRLIPVF
jgi:hypothetical protein